MLQDYNFLMVTMAPLCPLSKWKVFNLLPFPNLTIRAIESNILPFLTSKTFFLQLFKLNYIFNSNKFMKSMINFFFIFLAGDILKLPENFPVCMVWWQWGILSKINYSSDLWSLITADQSDLTSWIPLLTTKT